jgi:S1-C subfamily serine protease
VDADLTLSLIDATIQIEQPAADRRTVGTGFLVQVPAPDGAPRTVLVTAAHVFEQMRGEEARLGWRVRSLDGRWRYQPAPAIIRSADGKPLWTRHPVYDVAALVVRAPDDFARAAIPLAWLADERTFSDYAVAPGDEMTTLGYPNGYSANPAGFPILRTGRIASYPLTPSTQFPTFLIDLRALPGNSGGPVFMTSRNRRQPSTEQPAPPFVSGVLTKQVDLELGVVTQARFVRETIALLDPPGTSPAGPSPVPPPAIR